MVSEVVLASGAIALIGLTHHKVSGAGPLLVQLRTFIDGWADCIVDAADVVYIEEVANNLDLLVTREALWSICLSLVEFKGQQAGIEERYKVLSLARRLDNLFEHEGSTDDGWFKEARNCIRDGFPELGDTSTSVDTPPATQP